MSYFEEDFDLDGLIIGRTGKPAETTKEPIQPTNKLQSERWFNSSDGFFCIPRAIREDNKLTNAEFRVLVTLGSFVFAQDRATPSLETLKKYCGMSEGTISKATTSLEKKGWIIKEKRPYTSVLYYLTLPKRYKKGFNAT